MFLRPNILDRYIWRQVFGSMLTGVIVLTGVMVLGNVFKEMERLLGDTSSLPMMAALEFIGYVIPYSLIFTIPWALLTGILLVFGRLSADNEMTALRMTGRSMQRICAPVFLLAILLSGVCYFVNVDLAPYAKSRIKRLFYDLALDDPATLFQPGKILDRFPGYRIFTSARDGNKLQNVEIFETDLGFDLRYIRARQAEVVVTPGVTDFVLKLYKCHIEAPKVEGAIDPLGNMDNADAGEMSIIFPLSKLKEKTERVTASMKDTGTLWAEVRTGKDSLGRPLPDSAISASRTEANMRYSFSLACVTFCLVGIPLGITAQRRETSVGFALSLVVATCYIVFIIFANTMNEDPKAYPHLLMWIPNVIFMGVGAALFRKLMKK